ncbi:mycofactocin-coupled SDR family oxidoreductase [Streptomyces sp. NPDC015127]|uniref:mycofactocin-coupled SDR family oxidoreductase n=1 Tax=Streptomyces sp. NPDC015127 TaxID=3364939 RepID=UPI0036F4BB07
MGRAEGKVVVITGAARGQGRSHAVRLAEEGADIIAIDICEDIDTAGYAMAGNDELDETARLVKEAGRRVVVRHADVRDYAALRAAVEEGAAELGGIDVVIPNAGILPMGSDLPVGAFTGTIDVNLVGVFNTVHATLPHLREGASVIVVGSIASFMPPMPSDVVAGAGYTGYRFAKHVLVDYVKELALQLAPTKGRVNSIHPTTVDTEMSFNKGMFQTYRPDLENPTKEDIEPILASIHAMPISYVTQADVTHAVVYLASDESRYVTGTQIKIDGGALALQRL